MPKMFAVAGLLLSFSLGFTLPAIAENNSTPSFSVGIVRKIPSELSFESGCALERLADYPKNKFHSAYEGHSIFVSNFENQAIVNINGKNVLLNLVGSDAFLAPSSPSLPRVTIINVPSKGRKFVNQYRGGGWQVRINFTVTKVCAPHDEECERTWVNATVTVVRGSEKQSILTKGSCGT
jgi:hypothetical protein